MKKIIFAAITLLFASIVAVGAPTTLYVDGGTGTYHFSTLNAAIKYTKDNVLDDVIIDVSINHSTTSQITIPDNTNVVILNNTAGSRHAISFGVSTSRSIGIPSTSKLTVGGGAGILILRGTTGSSAGTAYRVGGDPVLLKVNGGELYIKDNVELCYGQNVVWIVGDGKAYLQGGVLHSASSVVVNVTKGTFTMSGGYITGHYKTGATTMPDITNNPILDIANVESYCGTGLMGNTKIRECINALCLVDGGKADGLNSATPVFVNYNSTFNMSGGSICGFKAFQNQDYYRHRIVASHDGSDYTYVKQFGGDDLQVQGAAVYVCDGKFNMSGGQIYASAASRTGALLQITSVKYNVKSTTETMDHSIVNITGGRFAYGSTYYTNAGGHAGGSAIRVEKGATVTMSGGRIDHCVCSRTACSDGSYPECGGAVRMISCDFELSGTALLDHNESYGMEEAYSGGAVAVIWQADHGVVPTIFNMKGGTIRDNYSAFRGGGVSCTDKGNKGSAELIVKLTGGTIRNNECNIHAGGLYVGSSADVTLDGTNIYNNKAVQNGGGVYVDKNPATTKIGTLTVLGSKVYSNTAVDGGGIYMGYSDVDINKGAKIYSNVASRYGGAAFIDRGTTYIRKGANLYHNEAVSGAGVYVNGGDANIEDDETQIYANVASENGGGLFIDGGTFNLSGGSIGKNGGANTAKLGAGVYLNGGTATMTGGIISYNAASENGGGLYSNAGTITLSGSALNYNIAVGNGGGVYANGGTTTINNGDVSYNKSVNGAGIYVYTGGKITINGGKTNNNTASGNGGGMFVHGGSAEMNGGFVSQNTASMDGGGFYAETQGKIDFSGDSSGDFGYVTKNIARNGGGVYITSGSEMTIMEAMITENRAILIDAATVPTTVYHGIAQAGKVMQGNGGGVYVGEGIDDTRKTKLEFKKKGGKVASLGIYDNIGEVSANEILSEGKKTVIYIPSVTDMKLSGYAGTASNWYEDYKGGDVVYDDSSKTDVVRTSGKTAIRYKDATDPAYYLADIDFAETRYICLALGLQYGKLVIKKTGLKAGDSAIFTLQNGDFTRSVILTGINDDGREVSVTLTRVEIGTWTITESAWSWAYTPTTPTKTVTLDDVTTVTVSFANTLKSSTPTHDEASVKNEF